MRPPQRREDREQQVTQRVAEGASNRDVAQQLKLSIRTVKGDLTRIFKIHGFKNRWALIDWWWADPANAIPELASSQRIDHKRAERKAREDERVRRMMSLAGSCKPS